MDLPFGFLLHYNKVLFSKLTHNFQSLFCLKIYSHYNYEYFIVLQLLYVVIVHINNSIGSKIICLLTMLIVTTLSTDLNLK
jgi:hypothetical protein